MPKQFTEAQAARIRQVYMLSGIRQGLSGNAIIDTLRAIGLGQRTEVMQKQIASLIGRPGRLPSLDAETLSTLYDQAPALNFTSRSSKNYVYSFKVSGLDLTSGRNKTVTLSIVSDRALIPGIAERMFTENVDFEQSGGLTPDLNTIEMQKPRKYTPYKL